MTGRPTQGLPGVRRLSGSRDFERVLKRGRRVDGRLLRLFAFVNEHGIGRLGLVASRRVGGAVVRNRAKRLARDAFRRLGSSTGWDQVVLLKVGAGGAGQREVDREYAELLERATRRSKGGGGREGGNPRR